MARRRAFIPQSPSSSSLEGRLAPSGLDWFSHQLNSLGDRLMPHHHNHNAAAGIEQMWKDSAKLSHPRPAGQVHQVHHGK